MSFYLGPWLVEDDPGPSTAWRFPSDPTQHINQTSNVEDLLVDPEDMDVIPEQIQFGLSQWTKDTAPSNVNKYTFFYAPVTEFYIVSTPYVTFYIQSNF